MGDFINAFHSLMVWLRSGSYEMRNHVRVIIEFERAEDWAYARLRLRKDFRKEHTMFSDGYGDDGPIPVQCFGIPFELTVREP